MTDSTTTIELSSDINIKLVRVMASDAFAIEAAQASVMGTKDNKREVDPDIFIQKLVSLRHGVPFEHTFFTFGVEVPIFVARQWVKHRMSSMNEMSGRYGKMIPKFYTPTEDRPMVNVGSKMNPKMELGSQMQYQTMLNTDRDIAQKAWNAYEFRMNMKIAEEMARSCLPLSTYTQFYWSVNARSLMGFLERRVESEAARVPTHPQWEINVAADKLEETFKQFMPLTHAAFVRYGRVAP